MQKLGDMEIPDEIKGIVITKKSQYIKDIMKIISEERGLIFPKDIEEGISGGIENLEEFTRLKKAGGGEVNLTIVRMPDINESGVESLFKTR